MMKDCRRVTAWILCAVMLFLNMAPAVYAADEAVDDGELVAYSPEWCARYGVDTDTFSEDGTIPEEEISGGELGIDGDNAHTIYGFLRNSMGLHSAAAVGILANIFAESSFRPYAIGDGGTSYGICQWHAGRWDRLKNYCNSNGYNWETLDGQLHYLQYETANFYPNTMAAIRDTENNADGAWRSAYLFCKNFEVPADTIAKSEQRGDLARDTFWPIYGEPDGENPEQPDPTPTEAPKKPIEERKVPEELQPSQEEEKEPEEPASTVLESDIPEDGIIPEGIWFAGITDMDYTGKKIVQDFRVYHSDQMLKEKKDYTVDYFNNKTAGVCVMTIILKGNYSGTYTQKFKINALDIAQAEAQDITLNYNGKEQKPIPKVTLDGTALKYDRDFTIPAYSKSGFTGNQAGNVSVSVDICGRGNYTGVKTISINYIGKQTVSGQKLQQVMMDKVKASSIPRQQYDPDGYEAVSLSQNNLKAKKGGAYVITLKYKGKTLSENDVEVLGIEGGDKPGKAYIIVRGRNEERSATGYSFVGEKRIAFNIRGLSLKGLKISGIEKSYAYTGEEICPVPKIDGIAGITPDDYVISYEDNIMPGKASVVVTGRGRYSGVKKKSFRIDGISIRGAVATYYYEDGSEVSENEIKTDYKRGGAYIGVSLSFNGSILQEGTDYKLKYSDHKKAGKATLTIKGIGKFDDHINTRYTIRKRDFSDNIRMYAADKPKGSDYEQKLWVTDIDGFALKEGRDYTDLKYFIRRGKKIITVQDSDVPKVGDEVYVCITGCGNYTEETLYTKYSIIKSSTSLAKAKIVIRDQVYTGGEIRITSMDQIERAVIGDVELLLGEDFTVIPGSYSNNINKGTASVTIRGRGEYNGQKTVKFKITASR